MKRRICILSCVLMLFTCTIRINAEGILPQNGSTEEGIYYQVVELNQDIMICNSDESINVTICVVFNGMVMPPKTKAYTKILRGKTYSSILNFQSGVYEDGKTHAYYSGTLTLQE